MHPVIACALAEHSDVFENPWRRLWRSAQQILPAVYGPDCDHAAVVIRQRHTSVHGTDAAGRRYRALAPEIFYWAHATFFESQIATAELFGTPLTGPQKQALYSESLGWYARYGICTRSAPRDYASFVQYWDDTVAQVLEPTAIARWGLTAAAGWPAPRPWMAGPPWTFGRPVGGALAWIARGSLPGELRGRLDLRWTASDERRLRALAAAVRVAWPLLPARVRLTGAASAAYRREGISAPLAGCIW
jgi:uncharacterized protein (DUF2236 family)